MRTRPVLVVAAATGALLLAACGDDDDGALEPTTVEVRAVDYGFEGLPERVAAGSTLTLTNESDDEAHEIVALHIPDDVDLSVEELLDLSDEELSELIPDEPPVAVLVAPPGEDGFAAVGDGTFADPGRYALVCFIPIGADPEAFLAAEGDGPPDVDGGPPHFTEGMFAELVVE